MQIQQLELLFYIRLILRVHHSVILHRMHPVFFMIHPQAPKLYVSSSQVNERVYDLLRILLRGYQGILLPWCRIRVSPF